MSEDESEPLTFGATCENAEWWIGRGTIYTTHAQERAQIRRILLPDKFDTCIDLHLCHCDDDVWTFKTTIEGHTCIIVGVPTWRGTNCYILVITIYYYAPGRSGRRDERQMKRFMRHVKRSGYNQTPAEYKSLVRRKDWQNE